MGSDTEATAAQVRAMPIWLRILAALAGCALLYAVKALVMPGDLIDDPEEIAYAVGELLIPWAVLVAAVWFTTRRRPLALKSFGLSALVIGVLIVWVGMHALSAGAAADPGPAGETAAPTSR